MASKWISKELMDLQKDPPISCAAAYVGRDYFERQRPRHRKLVHGHCDKSYVLLQVLRQPLPSSNDCRPQVLLVCNIHHGPLAQILNMEYIILKYSKRLN